MGSTSEEADGDEQPLTRVRISRGVRAGQARGDAGGVGGADGEQPVFL